MTEEAARPLAQFQRVAQVLREQIRAGDYPVGSQLPAITKLAEDMNCSHMTVKQALAALADEGVISTRRGVRAEVLTLPEATPSPSLTERLTRVEAQISELAHRLQQLESTRPTGTSNPD